MRISATVAALLIFPLGIAAARAAEKYPSEVRTITATTATSPCIGDPKTPVCAVETALACNVRPMPRFCRHAEGALSQAQAGKETYRIDSVKIYRIKSPSSSDTRNRSLFAEVRIRSISDSDEIYVYELQQTSTHVWTIIDDGLERLVGIVIDNQVEYIFKSP